MQTKYKHKEMIKAANSKRLVVLSDLTTDKKNLVRFNKAIRKLPSYNYKEIDMSKNTKKASKQGRHWQAWQHFNTACKWCRECVEHSQHEHRTAIREFKNKQKNAKKFEDEYRGILSWHVEITSWK